jgi:hypothetical protein
MLYDTFSLLLAAFSTIVLLYISYRTYVVDYYYYISFIAMIGILFCFYPLTFLTGCIMIYFSVLMGISPLSLRSFGAATILSGFCFLFATILIDKEHSDISNYISLFLVIFGCFFRYWLVY